MSNAAQKILDKTEWAGLVSPGSNKNTVPFSWYGFKHSFSSELVSELILAFGLSEGDTILDPFCGGATTLISAKFKNYNAYGLDISPFSIFLGRALTKQYDCASLTRSLDVISKDIDLNPVVLDKPLLRKSFSANTLKLIFGLRNRILKLDGENKYFFLLILFSTIDRLSRTQKAGGFLRITDKRLTGPKDFMKSYVSLASQRISEASKFKFSDSIVKTSLGDAREYPKTIRDIKFDAIITSPPYPNRHDYTRVYELELLIGFMKNAAAIKSLRYKTLRSHVEAKKHFTADGFTPPKQLENIISQIRSNGTNNPRVIKTLEGYFEDMYLCLREMKNVLKRNKHIGMVVSNVRFAGIPVPVDELLGEIGESIGLELCGIHVLRYRGNSSQQMLKYKRIPSRESLIVFKNINSMN